jgi:hypothetical protein
MAPYVCPAIADSFRGKFVLHFGKNQAANAVAVNGASRAPDLNILVHRHDTALAAGDIRTWMSYVASSANFSGDPPRDERAALERDHKARRVPFAFPGLMGRLGFS